MRHYHVHENTPGCLPESEGLTTVDLGAAREFAYDTAIELQDQGYRAGAPDADFYRCTKGDSVRVVEVVPCERAECAMDDDEV